MAMLATKTKIQKKENTQQELLMASFRQPSADWFFQEARARKDRQKHERQISEIQNIYIMEAPNRGLPTSRPRPSLKVDLAICAVAIVMAGGLVLSNNMVPRPIYSTDSSGLTQILERMDSLYELGAAWAVLDTAPSR